MPRILLTRHGDVEGIWPERFRGRADVQLTEKGLAQAAALAGRISGHWRPVKIYVSPLSRCVATGEAIAKTTGASCHILQALLDLDYGAWRWRTFEEVERESPALFGLWRTAPHLVRFPEGESLQELFARTAEAIRFILENHADETVVLVGHDSVNKAILLQTLDQPPSAYWKLVQAPCTLNELEIGWDRSRVVTVNDASHLGGGHRTDGGGTRQP